MNQYKYDDKRDVTLYVVRLFIVIKCLFYQNFRA